MTWIFTPINQTNPNPNTEKINLKIRIKCTKKTLEKESGWGWETGGDVREVYLEREESHRVLVRLKHSFV